MDPDATLERIAMALLDGDKDEARAGKKDLLNWLRNGGFEPRWASHPHAYAFVAGKRIAKPKGPKFSLTRVHLNQGGYANRGRDYFGHGAPLFEYSADDYDAAYADYLSGRMGRSAYVESPSGYSSYIGGHLRARDRNAAKAEIRKVFPGARF